MVEEVAVNRRWLVRNRSRIQHQMLKLDELGARIKSSGYQKEFWPVYGTLIGVAFSLWRAVFLIRSEEQLRTDEMRHGEKFLALLIETNAIGFPQDLSNSEWTAGYYLNNAMLRLHMLTLDRQATMIFSEDTLAALPLHDFDPRSRIYYSELRGAWEIVLSAFIRVRGQMKRELDIVMKAKSQRT